MPTPPAVTSWTVTGTTERTLIGPDGTPVPSIVVSYTTGLGQSGTVNVAKGQDTVDNIRQLVAAAAANLDAIKSLSSES